MLFWVFLLWGNKRREESKWMVGDREGEWFTKEYDFLIFPILEISDLDIFIFLFCCAFFYYLRKVAHQLSDSFSTRVPFQTQGHWVRHKELVRFSRLLLQGCLKTKSTGQDHITWGWPLSSHLFCCPENFSVGREEHSSLLKQHWSCTTVRPSPSGEIWFGCDHLGTWRVGGSCLLVMAWPFWTREGWGLSLSLFSPVPHCPQWFTGLCCALLGPFH